MEKLKVNSRPKLVEALLNKSWEELETIEFAGYLLFPETLRRRKADGTFEEIPVRLRVPREPEMRQSRLDARAWAKRIGLDTQVDADLFENMDTMCALARSIRNTTEPFEPWEPDPEQLEARYDRACLEQLWAKLEAYKAALDPRGTDLDEKEALVVIAAIAAMRNISPLADYDLHLQNAWLVNMAVQLQSFLEPKS